MAWVKFVREDVEIEVEDGISVLEAEIQAGLRPDAPCGGLGKCGKCLVKINGEVVNLARQLNLTAPINQKLIELVKQAESEPKVWSGSKLKVQLTQL